MQLIIRFIGIVTIACLGVGNKPCEQAPLAVRAYLPNGKQIVHPCTADPALFVVPHFGFIRIHVDSDQANTVWRKSEKAACTDNDNGGTCHAFRLREHEVIKIKGVTDGSGMDAAFVENSKLSWSSYVGSTTLGSHATEVSLATMLVNSGKVETLHFDNGMFYAQGTFKIADEDLVIAIDGSKRKITIPKAAVEAGPITIDIVNLEQNQALGRPGDKPDHPDTDFHHFFLHYMLADTLPSKCDGPKPDSQTPGPDLGASIACSNSNYP
jgi:hypothetical protein